MLSAKTIVNSSSQTISISHNDDISLKSLLLTTRAYLTYLLRSWKFITFCGFLTAFIFLAHGFRNPPLYRANINFMLNEDEGSALGGISSILGQFGLGGSSSESNLDKLIELSRARTILQSALFTRESINGQTDYLANHLIGSMEAEKKWTGNNLLPFGKDDELDLTGFRFTHEDFSSFSLLENKALKKLHRFMMGKELQGGAFLSDYSEFSRILNFSMTSTDADLSIKIVKNLYNKLDDYYFGKSVEKQTKNYNLIKTKYDSIQTALNSVMYGIAQFEDQKQGLVRKQDTYRLKQMKGEELKLAGMLAEVEKQYQLAQIAKQSNDAYIQLIDDPILPLKPVNKGRIYYFLLGGLVGGFLSLTYLIFKKIYQDTIA